MDGWLSKLGRFCAKHHWPVLIAWIAIIVVAVFVGTVFEGKFVNDFSLPGTESQDALNILSDEFPEQSGISARIVFKATPTNDQDIGTPAGELISIDYQNRVEGALDAARKLDQVIGVGDPYTVDDGAINSPYFTVAFADVQYAEGTTAGEIGMDGVNALQNAVEPFRTDALDIQFGGELLEENPVNPPESVEVIGIIAALIILFFTLGSAVAMGMPVLSAILGVGVGVMIIQVVANWLGIMSVTPQVATMVGLGVGIDYALFIVSRHKDSMEQGYTAIESAGIAVATSGRAVVTAGSTVIVALLGLLVFDVPSITTMAYSIAIVVIVSIAQAVTLLPAVLGLLGSRINKGRLAFVVRGMARSRAGEGAGARWGRVVTRAPWLFGALGVIALVVIAIPMLSMQLGPLDSAADPPSSTTYKSYQMMANAPGFGPGFNAPLLVVLEFDSNSSSNEQLAKNAQDAMTKTKDVEVVTPPTFNDKGNVATIIAFPTSSGTSHETNDLVNDLRKNVLPQSLEGTNTTALVGGLTATFIDLGDRIADRLIVFIAVVIGIAFLILGTVFKSIFIPIKAAVLNLLVLGATYGVIVAVFQWGWLSGLFGVPLTQPIISFVPPIIFAVLFGLSMDYEVFIMSRIHEEYGRSHKPREAVAYGTGKAVRLIGAAGLVMICVFLAFVLIDNLVVKVFGLGLAAAIFMDVLFARFMLVPSFMTIAGKAAFWMPKWLKKILPEMSVEGSNVPNTVDTKEEQQVKVG